MKSLKAAAVLAGSLIAAAVAAPSYAADGKDLAATGLDTDLRTAVPFELMPVEEDPNLLGGEGTVLQTTKDAMAVVNEAKPVHGDLGLRA